MWSPEGGHGRALDHFSPSRSPLLGLGDCTGCGHLSVNHEGGEADLLPGRHGVAVGNPGSGPAGTREFGTRAQRDRLARSVGLDVFNASSWLEPRAGQL